MASGRQIKLLAAGTGAPEFSLGLLDGGVLSLREILARGPALLAFFKISCPVCQMTFPFLERIHVSGGLAVYGVSQNDSDDTREFNEDFRITFPTLLDLEDRGFAVSNAYGISSVPTLFLVEPGGTISYVAEGWQKAAIARLADLVGVSVFQAGDNVPEWKAG